MRDGWYLPTRLFDGMVLQVGAGLRIADGKVAEIGPAPTGAIPLDGTLTPGFVDLQVNGGGGALFNNAPHADGLRQIAAAHRKTGTVAILPTLITDSPDVMRAAVAAMLEVWGAPGIAGIHFEGPHISVAKRGTHAAAHVRPFDDVTRQAIATLRKAGIPVMITLAPEVVAPDEIAALCDLGAVVSVGHSNADAGQVDAALAAGATCATHLFNAMSGMTARAPGVAGAVLSGSCAAGLICDGIHVDDRMLRLALAARAEGLFLVSDAMATVEGPDHFQLYGQTIRLQNGRLINAEGHLAGAHLTQAMGLRRLVSTLGVPLERGLRMAITTPARLMDLPGLAQLQGRAITDCLLLSETLDVTRLG